MVFDFCRLRRSLLTAFFCAVFAQAGFAFDPWPEEEWPDLPPVEGFTDREVREAMYFRDYYSDFLPYDDFDPQPRHKRESVEDAETRVADALRGRERVVGQYWSGPWHGRWQPFPALDLFYRSGFRHNEQLVDFGIGYDDLYTTDMPQSLYYGLGGFYHEGGARRERDSTMGLELELGYSYKWALLNLHSPSALYSDLKGWRNPIGGVHVDVRAQFGVVRADDVTPANDNQTGIRIGQTTHAMFVMVGFFAQTAIEIYPNETAYELEAGVKFFVFSFGYRHKRDEAGRKDQIVLGMRLTL